MRQPKSLYITASACALAGASAVGCASAPYNPDHLRATELSRVAGICQSVMGLSPEERPVGGNWLGNDRLDYWTSHYDGCVLSLSDSLQSAASSEGAQQAEADCRAKGLPNGSPDLALCVLQAISSRPEPTGSRESVATATPVSAQFAATGSYYRASPHETARREQVACAALGLSPARDAFKSCVRSLNDTFYSIDHPID
jgi:hypothetical protein